jgi:hypothetical protein
MGTYLRFNVGKARAVGKARGKAYDSGATETHAFKTSPLGIIIGDGLDLDAFTVFITNLHPTEEKKTSNKCLFKLCEGVLQGASRKKSNRVN